MKWTGEVKLLDFGIAKQAGKAVERGKSVQGKYEYMSPEQVRGRALDARSDVFALGVCLYEALTGRQLYGRDGAQLSMMAIMTEPPPSLERDRPGLSRELDAIVQRALQKNPHDRWPSAAAMEQALEKWLAANGHAVGPQRVAVAIGTLFTPAEKSPLPPESKRMTGTLQAMDASRADEVLAPSAGGEGWAQTFGHDSEPPPVAEERHTPLPPPPRVPDIAVAPAPTSQRRAWIVVMAIGIVVGLAAAVAIALRLAHWV